ncbi:MAG TPA: glycoside hydrolase family 32 protein, partial [Luteolibacter sp.]|nr:glycoside hydrolase family 32 protein [Luteolibacter sp.]
MKSRILCAFIASLLPLSAQEPMRPAFHFTAEKNWLNDPNGLVYHEGEWHLFHQYNPHGDTWGHMSWGHAVSRDLLTWEYLPIAIPEKDGIMAFSGSAVIDHANTSGFGTDGHPPMVAIYTGNREGRQDQRLSYGVDNGRSWTMFEGNPVLDVGKADFRDPKVFWHAGKQRWTMVVALPVERKVSFYSSADLKKWDHLSDFGPSGSVKGVWECPDLFEAPIEGTDRKRWVLSVSVGDHSIAGGSGTQYFTGEFDGERFTSDPPPKSEGSGEPTNWIDFGRDMYAGVTWNNAPDGKPRWIGWMSNLKYAGHTPTTPWRSAMSLPRMLSLRQTGDHHALIQRPIEALDGWRGQLTRLAGRSVDEANKVLEGINGKRFDMLLRIDPGNAAEAGIQLRTGKNEFTAVGWSRAKAEVFVDRSRSGNTGFHGDFSGRHAAPLELKQGMLELRIITDDCSVEVFADDGARVITDLIFPSESSQGLAFV